MFLVSLEYRLVRPPGQGGLYLGGGAGNLFQRLATNATFTQVDILSGQLKYKLAGMARGPVEISFLRYLCVILKGTSREIF